MWKLTGYDIAVMIEQSRNELYLNLCNIHVPISEMELATIILMSVVLLCLWGWGKYYESESEFK